MKFVNTSFEEIKYIINFKNAYITDVFYNYMMMNQLGIDCRIQEGVFIGMNGFKNILLDNLKCNSCNRPENFENLNDALNYYSKIEYI